MKRLLKIGHRGAPRIAPANTMASFQAAYESGCDWVECDCRPSSDGVIVLAHDETVRDRAGRRYVIAQHTAEELGALDLGAGQGAPTLEELVVWAAGRVGVMADVKQGGYEKEIGAALAPLPPNRKIVPGADERGRRRFRELYPELPISVTVDVAHEAELVRRWQEIDTDAVTFEFPLITPDRVADLHRRNIRVYAWTVDDLAAMRSLVAMGVDGIISNRADLLAKL